MRNLKRALFFFLFVGISFPFLFYLREIEIIKEFGNNDISSFIEYIFIGFFLLYLFIFVESLFSKKRKGFALKVLKEKKIFLGPRFLRLTIRRQFFIGVLDDQRVRVLSKIAGIKKIQKGDIFLYYYKKYSGKGIKISVFDKKDILLRLSVLIAFLLLSQCPRILMLLLN